MRLTRTVMIDGQAYDIFISDEMRALQEAQASGRAILGVWDARESYGAFLPAPYVVESLEQADEELLERVIRRHIGMPWKIAETGRLKIREFEIHDIKCIYREELSECESVFLQEDTMAAYIRGQYNFYEYGIWAVVEKTAGTLIGMAGLTNFEFPSQISFDDIDYSMKCDRDEGFRLDLGYHIFGPYRKQAYAMEACRAILAYAWEYLWADAVYTKIDASNEASIKTAQSLGFHIIQTYSEGTKHMLLYELCCPENRQAESKG